MSRLYKFTPYVFVGLATLAMYVYMQSGSVASAQTASGAQIAIPFD